MKFKELPEGYYFIHAVRNTVCVQRLENPETAPRYLTETNETTKVVHDGRQYKHFHGILNDMEVEFKTWDEMAKERKSRGGSLSHVTRRLRAGEPLKGKTLKTALGLLPPMDSKDGPSKFNNGIVEKIKAGKPLDEYELHIMEEMFILSARLS